MIDERFYPVTDRCDWELLRRALDPCPIDGWMFMEASTDGWRFYKHSTTRERLVLRAKPHIFYADGGWNVDHREGFTTGPLSWSDAMRMAAR